MKNSWIRASLPVGLCLCAQLLAIPDTATGQSFTTVINVPPDIAPSTIGSDTQLNLTDGGTIDSIKAGLRSGLNSNIEVNISGGVVDHGIQAGAPRATNTNVFVNVSGGTVKGITAYSGSTVNISDGTVGNVWANDGSVVNFSGGSLGDRSAAESGSTFNISGGSIGEFFGVNGRSTVNISGGTFGDHFSVGFRSTLSISGGVVPRFQIFDSSTLNVSGGNLGGFSSPGINETTITGSEFLFDGAPIPGLESAGNSITFPTIDHGLLTTTFTDGAVFAFDPGDVGGSLTLIAAEAPPKPAVINSPSDPAPLGLRAGQTLNLSNGTTLNENFYAIDATLNMSGGSIGRHLQVMGTSVDITGGSVGQHFQAHSGSTVNISGGDIAHGLALSDSTATITGGNVSRFRAQAGSTFDISGGTIGGFKSSPGSSVNVSGGSLRLDGAPVPGLETPGLAVDLNLPEGSILTGRLTDGSVFVFSSQSGDQIADGTLRFTSTPVPATGPSIINVPSATAPKGLWVGQTLNLSEGGVLDDNFAAVEATVNIAGGTVGQGLEVVNSAVTITGGRVGSGFTVLDGSTVNLSSGNIGENLSVQSGSTVNISGGVIGISARLSSGATVNISGGEVGGFSAGSGGTVNISGGVVGINLTAGSGSTFNISGGSIGERFTTFSDSTINISGGEIGGNFLSGIGSRVNITGGEFFLDGVAIPGLDTLGTSTGVNIPSGSRLTVTLADGTVRTFGAKRFDLIADGTLNLINAPLPTAANTVNVPVDPAPRGLRIGQTLNLNDGGILESDFTAGIGSTVNISGGEVGDRFIAEANSTINITGGDVGSGFNAFSGSTVNITGGSVGVVSSFLDSHFFAESGSTVNISGGIFGSRIFARAGSTVNLIGRSFILDGVDLTPGLTLNEVFSISGPELLLEGILADGSPFSFSRQSIFINFNDFFDPDATLTVTLVPEPGTAVMLAMGFWAMGLRRRRECV